MADLAPQDRLQPSLLDRLTDDEPTKTVDSRDQRVLSMRRLRACILRDLTSLLNAGNPGHERFEGFGEVASSTVNFGVRNLAGAVVSPAVVTQYERELQKAILDFEPRILAHTLRVRPVVGQDRMDHRALAFEIEGELWADPVPMRVLLKTLVDVETGEATVMETSGSSDT